MKKLEKPIIRALDLKAIEREEEQEFIVFKPCWVAANGKPSEPKKKGDKVLLKGNQVKDLYYQNKIMYEEDFNKVVAFEKDSNEDYNAQYSQPESINDSTGKKLSEENKNLKGKVEDLNKQNAELQKQFSELAATVEELKKVKK